MLHASRWVALASYTWPGASSLVPRSSRNRPSKPSVSDAIDLPPQGVESVVVFLLPFLCYLFEDTGVELASGPSILCLRS